MFHVMILMISFFLEFRRIAAYLYKGNNRWGQSVALCKKVQDIHLSFVLFLSLSCLWWENVRQKVGGREAVQCFLFMFFFLNYRYT